MVSAEHMLSTCGAQQSDQVPILVTAMSEALTGPPGRQGDRATGCEVDWFDSTDSTDSIASTHLGLDGSYSDESGPEISATFEARALRGLRGQYEQYNLRISDNMP